MRKKSILPLYLFYSILLISCSRNNPPAPLSASKSITEFVFKKADHAFLSQDIQGTIVNDTIKVQMPIGVSLANLIPTIKLDGKNIVPANRAAQDFSNIVTYTVTAEDGSSKQFRVAVTHEANSYTLFLGSVHSNPAQTSYFYAIDANTGTVKWKLQSATGIVTPTEFSNGIVYTGIGRNITAIDTITRAIKWQYLTGGQLYSAPIVVNGVLYINSDDQNLYALDAATGTLKWKFAQLSTFGGGNYSSPTVHNGVVYFGSTDNHIYAVDAITGALKWKRENTYSQGSSIQSSPCIDNGVLYIGSSSLYLLALNITDGSFKWACNLNGIISSSPTVSNGTVYVGSSDGYLYAIDANTGVKKWQTFYGGAYVSPIVSNGVVYIGGGGSISTVFAIDASTGARKWTYDNHDYSLDLSPIVVDGVVYIGSFGSFFALDALNGTVKWRVLTTHYLEDIHGSPCVVDKLGNVYASSVSGRQN